MLIYLKNAENVLTGFKSTTVKQAWILRPLIDYKHTPIINDVTKDNRVELADKSVKLINSSLWFRKILNKYNQFSL